MLQCHYSPHTILSYISDEEADREAMSRDCQLIQRMNTIKVWEQSHEMTERIKVTVS